MNSPIQTASKINSKITQKKLELKRRGINLRKKDRDISGRWIQGRCTIMGTIIPCICSLSIPNLLKGLRPQTPINLNILTRPIKKIQAPNTTKMLHKDTKVCLQIITILMATQCMTISTHYHLKKDLRALKKIRAKITKNLTTILCIILGGTIHIICRQFLLPNKVSRASKILKIAQNKPIFKERGQALVKTTHI